MKAISASEFPYSSKDFQTASGVLRYVDQGQGDEVLLCVHGNPTWSFYYRKVIESFSATHRVIAVDHLGCGRSEKPGRSDFGYSLANHRDHLVNLIDRLDLTSVNLLAHDWGGAIGLSALLERREKFKTINLLNTGAFPPPYIPLRISACRIPVLGTLAVRGLNAFAKAAVPMAMSRQKLSTAAAAGLLAPYDSWTNRVAIDAFVKDIPMKPSHPTYSVLEALDERLIELADMPSNLIWGMQDWCFRPECLHRFQEVWPSAVTTEISDAGHYVLEDAPEETVSALRRFLQA